MAGQERADAALLEELRRTIADLVDEDPGDIADTDDLFEIGLQSIALMRLVGRWREEGHAVGFGELAAAPTLVAWAALLTAARQPVAAEPAMPEADASADGAEFDLALLQHVYWAGCDPGQPLGGVAPHLYLEFDGPGLDPQRLTEALATLVRRHDMLRARITDNGRQEILPAPPSTLAVHDLRDLDADERAKRLDAVREEMLHELLAIERGEVFREAVSLLPDGARLHLDVDTRRATRDAEHARAYWADRLPGLPGAPEFRADPKEIYEHAVSVQLAQDEVAAVSVPGSVVVDGFMRVVPRGSVQHLGSRVRGRLRPDATCWGAFARLFPAVTASGLPKALAFAAIGRHEDGPRGLHAGSVLTVDHEGALDAALVLRSVDQRDGRTWLRAGAGIVAQSTPERELEETREKLRSVSRFLVGPRTVGS
jgi:aryl carrier-like protein